MAEIKPNQRKALEALAAGGTVQQAALAANVTERTIYDWRTQEAFKMALQEASDQIMADTTRTLAGAAVEAVQTLQTIFSDTEAPASTRVSAARAVLDAVIRHKQFNEIVERIAFLERTILKGLDNDF